MLLAIPTLNLSDALIELDQVTKVGDNVPPMIVESIFRLNQPHTVLRV